MRFSKVVIIIMIAGNFWFTYRVLQIAEMGYQEPIALIGAWFGFTGGEFWLLSTITKKKMDKEEVEDEYNNGKLG